MESVSYRLDTHRLFYDALYGIGKYVFWFFLKILCRLKVEGRENLPKKGPFIITCNHFSYIDSLIIAAACRKRFYIGAAKKKLLSSAFMRFFMRLLNTLVFETSENFIGQSVTLLQQGHVMLIYPALGRSRDGKLQEFKTDIGKIILKSGVPVVPSFIGGSSEVMPPDSGKLKRGALSVRFGKALHFQDRSPVLSLEDKAGQITNEIRENIKIMLESAEARDDSHGR